MIRTRVGIVRGGTSSEYETSLATGAAMMRALPEDAYDVRDIFVDKTGLWHVRGIPAEPARALSQVDVVLNALHGGPGEDGTVQRILERAGVPFAGSRARAASLSLDKIRAREAFEQAGIRIPRGLAFSLSDGLATPEMARLVFARFGPPYAVKPPRGGGGQGIIIADSILALPDAIADVLDACGSALVEEFVLGREAVVGIIEGFRGEELYALPPARVALLSEAHAFDDIARLPGITRYVAPGDFSYEEKRELMRVAREAHRALELSHFSRADIRLDRRGRAYLLEANASPKLHEGAVLPQMLEVVGSTPREFLEHTIALAQGR